MKWIRERDALIAQTLAFVQSVSGRKDDVRPPDTGMAAPVLTTPVLTTPVLATPVLATPVLATPVLAAEIVSVQAVKVQTTTVGFEPLQPNPPEQAAPPPSPLPAPPPRPGSDFRSEMQARIANFRKHQERFEREREEYCAATLTKLRAAIRDGGETPSARK